MTGVQTCALPIYALVCVVEFSKTILPSWMVVERIPRHFDCLFSLEKCDMLVAVLAASDGSCSHTVTMHGEYVFDANEKIALNYPKHLLTTVAHQQQPKLRSAVCVEDISFVMKEKSNKSVCAWI